MFKTLASLVLISLVTAPPSAGLKYTVHMEAHQSAAAAQDPMAAQMNAMMAPMMMQVFPSGGLDQTVTIGEKATRTEQRQPFAGLPAGAVTILRPDGSSVVLDAAARTFWKLRAAGDGAGLFQQLGLKPEIKVAKTGQFETIEGMRSEKVTVTISISEGGMPPIALVMDVWLTDAIKAPTANAEAAAGMLAKFGLADANALKALNDGRFMLKQVMTMFGVEIVTTVKDVTKPEVSDALFEVPGDYKEIAPPRG